ncbi:MAG: hypothetical protein N3E36_04935 [Sulfolobales archaeon]|nr:hypothetical protein [Sulfolobales archaeon]MCX8199360.1 hypothetical protein [Sulfolobales archaeon]MDW8170326.1 hypothetical protein [Desulfurococcaceae archaeon]
MKSNAYECLEYIQNDIVVNWALSESRACIDRFNAVNNSMLSELMELYTISSNLLKHLP